MHKSRLTRRTLTLAVTAIVVLGGTVAVAGSVAADPATTADATVIPAQDGSMIGQAQDGSTTGQAVTEAVGQQRAPANDTNRIDFLEIRALDDGEYAYQFRVRGYVQRTRVDEAVKSEANDQLTRNDDGTVTVTGTTGNGLSDAYVIVGEIVSFRKTQGESDGELTFNGLTLTADELLRTETVEVVSRDEDEEIRYEIRARGSVDRIETEDDVAGDVDDRISRNDDGTVTIRGVTDDQDGDAFRVRGEVLSFRQTGGESRFRLRLDGLDVDPDTLRAGAGRIPGSGGDDGDDGYDNNDDDGDDGNDSDNGDDGDDDNDDDGDDGNDSDNGDDGDDDNDDDGDDVNRIDECTRIDEPGRYVLTGDVLNERGDTCLVVQSSDVTIDGDGHRIDGVDAIHSTGVRIVPADEETISDVTVRDIGVSDWDTGVQASARRGGSVETVTLDSVTSSSNVGFGVHFGEVDAGRVVGATVRENGGTGVLIEDSGPDSAVVDSRVDANDGYGVVFFDAPHAAVVRGNQVTNNDGKGIAALNGVTDTEIRNNVVRGNEDEGISLADSSTATVRNNVVRASGESGLSGDDVREATIEENEISRSGAYGVELRYTDRSTLEGNDVRWNGDSGVFLQRSDDNTVVRNVVCRNLAAVQIRVDADSNGNDVRGNRLSC